MGFNLKILPRKSLAVGLLLYTLEARVYPIHLMFQRNKIEPEKKKIWRAKRQRAQDFEGEALFVL